MKNLILVLSAAAAITFIAPVASNAQIGIDVPGVGVRIGELGYRDYDRPRYREGREYREREVRRACRTVTIERDDGSMRRIRRCD